MKKANEAPGLEPFKVEPLEPTEDGIEAFKGWLPADGEPGIEDEHTGRVHLETLRRFIRESSVTHRSTSPGKKYIGRAFKGRSAAERERIIQRATQDSINRPDDDKRSHHEEIEKKRTQIAKRRHSKSTALTSEKKKKRRKKCDDLHGKCPGHWYMGGISITPMIGGGE